MTNVEIVARWIDLCNGRDAEASLDEVLTEDFEMIEAPAIPGAHTLKGRAALERYISGWSRQWSEWAWHADEFVDVPPERVLVDARLALRGLRSDAWVERRWAYVFTIRDGRLCRQEGFDDLDAARRALGISRDE